MAALEGALPTLSTPADALTGGFSDQPVTTGTTPVLAGAYPGTVATLTVVVAGGSIGAFEIDAESHTFSASSANEFTRQIISVDPTDGSLTKTDGVETSDQTAGSAAKPSLPALDVEIYTALVDDTTLVVEQAARGTGLVTVSTYSVDVTAGEIDGQAFEGETISVTAASSSEFRRDKISVDPSDGSITKTDGSETSDQTSGSAALPATPTDEVVLFELLVSDSAVVEELDNRGTGVATDATLSVAMSAGLIDGVAIAGQNVAVSASTSSNYAKDLVSVDAAGSVTVTVGTEAANLTLAEIPDCPDDEVGLFAIGVGNAATGVTTLYLAGARGLVEPASATA